MPDVMKEHGSNGAIIQVFVPRRRLVVSTLAVTELDVVRFSAGGFYEMNQDGVKVPFPAGRTIGVPYGVTQIDLYDTDGTTPLTQVVEVM